MKKILCTIATVIMAFGLVSYSGPGVAHPCSATNHLPCAAMVLVKTQQPQTCARYDEKHRVAYTVPCNGMR